ncbi:MAG: class I SAM-dependent methyltransferase [Desulfovibrionales bacterium]|nr:class I SAM-dependent methyltransferase [Desulfovibrionales bacterium]
MRDYDEIYRHKQCLRESKKNVGHAVIGKEVALTFLNRELCRVKIKNDEELSAEHFYLNRSTADADFLLKLCNGHININKDTLIFDPGCGTGRHLLYLVDKFGCKGIGVDVYSPAIEVAKRASWDKHVEFYSLSSLEKGVLERLIPDGCDYVFINSWLNHVYGYDGYGEFIKKIVNSCRMILLITSIKNDLQKYLPNPEILVHEIRGKSQYALIKGNKC